MLDRIRQELAQALRAIRRNPGFSAVVVATLAVGIAASTVVFSVMNPYLLRTLPFGEPDRLVQLGLIDPVSGWDASRFSLPQLEDWKQRTRAFEDIGAYHYRSRNVTGAVTPERVTVGIVSGNLFDVLRSPTALGRTIQADDAGPGGGNVVAIRALGPVLPEALFRVGTASLDGRVLLFSMVLTLAAPLVFGLTPILSGTRADLTIALKQGSRGTTQGEGLRTRRVLVMAQVALAVVLVTSAGLMVRSFIAVQQADLGFSADPLLIVEVLPPEHAYAGRDQVASYFDRATDALRGIPGVRAAATVNPLPLNHENYPVQFATPELAGSPPGEWPAGLWTRAAPGYFGAMRIPLLGGRDFAASDGAGAAPVVIVSRMLAEQHWPGADAVGRTLLLPSDPEPLRVTIIGVVGDIRHTGLTGPVQPHVYRPIEQSFARGRFIVVSAAAGDPAALAADVRARLAQVDANLPLTIRPMSGVVRENDFQWSISSIALTAFGSLAVLLAALGLYGLIAYSVAQRRRELGIRLALGATGRQVRDLVVREATRLAGFGLLAGIIVAIGVGRLLASQLYGVGGFDPVTLAAVLVLFAAVAIVASARPAGRAARIAPQEVMGAE